MAERKTWGPFNGRHLTVIVVALVVGVVMLPGAVWAVDTFSNVALEDPVSGTKAAVDSSRHVLVATTPHPPASTWYKSVNVQCGTCTPNNEAFLVTPQSGPINISSITVSLLTDSVSDADVRILAYKVPSSATTCYGQYYVDTLWHVNLNASATTAVSAPFPVPLQFRPPSGYKACISAKSFGQDVGVVNVSGFFGG